MESLAFLSQIVILILLAPIFAKLFKVSVAVVEIVLGALVVWMGFIESGNELFHDIAKIGFFFLMFLAGLEINIKNFFSHSDNIFKKTLIYFICLYGLSVLTYFLFDLNPIYIVAIPIVSLGMIMALINEHGRKHKWLEMALIIGVIGELISIAALVIFDAIIAHGIGEEFYKNITILIIILLVAFYAFKGMNVLFWWFPRLKRTIMPDSDNMSQDIRVSMAMFFILIAIMQYLAIDMVLGAFIAGVFIANFFEHKVDLPHTLHRVGFGFLVPMFFIYVGTTLDLNVLFTQEIMSSAGFIVCAMITVRIISSFIAYYGYFNIRDTILFSFSYSMPLTFLIAIATIALNNRAIDISEYYAFVLASVLQALLFMVSIKLIMIYTKKKSEKEQ